MRVDQLLARSAARFPDKPAVIFGNERCSYAQLEQTARRLAQTLVDAGIRPGDRVAVSLENSIEAVAAIFGVLKAGAVFFIASPRTRPERLAYLLADSGAAASITHGLTITRLAESRAENEIGSRLISPSDLAALVYTSGSTGEPKGVMLTHGNITSSADAICEYLELSDADVIVNVLPLAFSYSLGQVTTAFNVGATLVLERSFAYPAAVIDTMVRERVTGFPLVPTIATLLLQQDITSRRIPHLRYITNAAAALSVGKLQSLRGAFPSVKIYSMYGQAECHRISYLPPDQIDARPTSVGVAIPNSEVFIVDERGRRVQPGTIGELVVRGPHVMKGYWNMPEATALALRPGGGPWDRIYHTGDLFRMDQEGFLYFVDRKDDVIKTRGEKVAPRQVEEVIAQMPGVAEVSVFGVPDELLGEAIAAAITPLPNVQLTRQQIQRHCLEHLETFMVPTIVDIRDALPMTPTGKVSRRELRALAMAAPGALA
jgi:amino acid adenylation domain-containing protein